jgi:ankyrin repeat protein
VIRLSLLLPALLVLSQGPAFEDAGTLLYAARTGKVEQVRELLQAEPGKIDLPDQEKRTPLHYAAREGHAEVVSLLLSSGSRAAGAQDSQGETPLHWAAAYARTEVIRALAERRADMNVRNRLGQAPLHKAMAPAYQTELKHEEAAAALVELGADVNAQDATGAAPLHIGATLIGKAACVKAVLTGKKADPNLKNGDGRTPLHVAAYFARKDVVELLLAAGADPAIKDKKGKTAAALARKPYGKGGNGAEIVALLEAGQRK